jgi:uncharacterized protein DUF4224
VFLTRDDVIRLTGKQRFAAQRRVLDALGIRYRQAATGEPLVRESDLDGTPAKARNRRPNWDWGKSAA